jgi:hypothetical protein
MTAGIIIAVVAVVIVVLLAGGLASGLFRPGGTGSAGGLRHRFGPEYDRTVARHGGDERAAREDLRERLKRHADLKARPLSAEQCEQYVARWTVIQERFVDSPAQAVSEADVLLARVLDDRGFHDEDALSVHHPRHMQGYREMRAAAGAQTPPSTEELRAVLVQGRALFDDLIEAGPQDRAARTERTADRTEEADRADRTADEAGEPKHRAAHRFHLRTPHRGGA